MIEVFSGTIGSGKTYSAVYRILCHLVKGGIVATNIELIWPGLCKAALIRAGVELERDQLVMLVDEQIHEFHKHTPSGSPDLPSLVVIDEAPLNFDSRDFAQSYKNDRETYTFLRQSRKVDTDIIFIAQDPSDLDKKMRHLAEYFWRFRDLKKWTIPGLGIRFPFNMILAVQLDYDGRTIFKRDFVPKDKLIFECYNTKSLLRSFERLEGLNPKRKLKTRKKSFMTRKQITLLVLAVNLIFALLLIFS